MSDTSSTYILLGPPGSGKSTEAKILVERCGLEHIEIGSELRKVAQEDTLFGELVKDIIYTKKELVPDGIIGAVIDGALQNKIGSLLLDGAPRCVSQIDEVEEVLHKHGRKIHKLIYLSLSSERCVERISNRFLCQECKTAYKKGVDTEVESGICSRCQGTVSQRYDDTPEGVLKRYQVFHDQTVPVIERFREDGKVIEVPAEGDPEVVADQILHAIQ